MAVLPIILLPNPILRQVAKPVASVDGAVRRLMADMLETMYHAKGIGLAAPQVGVSKRVIVMDCSDDDAPPSPLMMANPEIIWRSAEQTTTEEGCLSIPNHRGDVMRPAEVKLNYIDAENARQEIHATGLLATCIQHEIDHLNGVLFIDYLSRLKRDMIIRKMTKEAKEAKGR